VKILVGVKRVVDASFPVRVRQDGTGVELDGVRMVMNPFDEIALEEAIRLREKGIATEVLAVSIGPARAEETLRAALAMGADRALLVTVEQRVEPLAVAKLLKAIVLEENVQLALLGKQAIDDDANQTGQMLAALLGWGQATFASKIDITGGTVHVTREIDTGLQTMEMPLPAVITADLRLNTPRFAALPKIMAARKKPIEHKTALEFGVDIAPRIEVLSTTEPPRRAAGEIVASVPDLLQKLRAAGVLER
jgi:electron transfer flavoprotein beta subunit